MAADWEQGSLLHVYSHTHENRSEARKTKLLSLYCDYTVLYLLYVFLGGMSSLTNIEIINQGKFYTVDL